MATCSSCGAEIIFATTVNGKQMPFDPEPSLKGEWELSTGPDEGFCFRPLREKGFDVTQPLYVTHWATCPSADQHRKS